VVVVAVLEHLTIKVTDLQVVREEALAVVQGVAVETATADTPMQVLLEEPQVVMVLVVAAAVKALAQTSTVLAVVLEERVTRDKFWFM
jgi:hypothetical protein